MNIRKGFWIITWVLSQCPARNIILWLGITTFVLMSIFPPWVHIEGHDLGYKFISTPPTVEFPYGITTKLPAIIDFKRLAVQWAVVVVVTGGLIYTFRDKKGKND